jgi:pimeloyl-ACP methyl ester carboxylesterase
MPETDERLKLFKSVEGHDALRSWYEDLLEEFEVPVESKYVETRFGRTHMLVAGPEDADPLILIQGLTGSAPLWRRQFPALSQEFRVIALDTVGQPGRSAPNPPSFLNDDYAHWLADVMDGLGLASANFAGVSTGGSIVLRMALAYPQRVRRIAMISPTGIKGMRLPVKIWLQKYMFRARDADALADSLTTRSVTRSSSGRTRDRQLARLMVLASKHFRVDRSLGIYDETSGRVNFFAGLKVLRRFWLAEPAATLRRCEVPALLLLGEQELFFNPDKVARRARALMPDIEVDIVPGASHGVISEHPEYVNPALIRFFMRPP